MSQWELQGDCTNSFDEDGECLIGLFADVSDFAVVEENAVPCEIDPADLEWAGQPALAFTIEPDRGILLGYDETNDVHYFFRQVAPLAIPA